MDDGIPNDRDDLRQRRIVCNVRASAGILTIILKPAAYPNARGLVMPDTVAKPGVPRAFPSRLPCLTTLDSGPNLYPFTWSIRARATLGRWYDACVVVITQQYTRRRF